MALAACTQQPLAHPSITDLPPIKCNYLLLRFVTCAQKRTLGGLKALDLDVALLLALVERSADPVAVRDKRILLAIGSVDRGTGGFNAGLGVCILLIGVCLLLAEGNVLLVERVLSLRVGRAELAELLDGVSFRLLRLPDLLLHVLLDHL